MNNLTPRGKRKIEELKDGLRHNEKYSGRPAIRTTTELWRSMLLSNEDTILVDACVRKIEAKSIGAGVYQLTLIPKEI